MAQNYPRHAGRSYQQPPTVSGAEERSSRTGVAVYRHCGNSQDYQTIGSRRSAESKTGNIIASADTIRQDTGYLPDCALLAYPYVPMQKNDSAQYPLPRALARGTLFPALDLPLYGMINADKCDCPLTELMALEFSLTELGLYLDMHPEDHEALELFRNYAENVKYAKETYQQEHGPLRFSSADTDSSWDWTCGPWPWEL